MTIHSILTLVLTLLACFATANTEITKPNVLLIAVDDLNDWVGYLGGNPQAHTPSIDALAKSGAAFQYAYCAAPVCGPSRTALMYSIAPHKSGSYGHHDLYSPKNRIPADQDPLNQVFQKNGYYTAGCGKIFHYREVKRGWDTYVGQFPESKAKKILKVGTMGYGIQPNDNNSETAEGKMTDWAIEQLQKQPDPSANSASSKPFFIALGLRKPHLPWVAPKKYFERLDPKSIKVPNVPADDLKDLPDAGKVFAHNMVGFHDKNDHASVLKDGNEGWQKLAHAYLANCSFADATLGRLLDALNKSPHRDSTIVVLWGDHGWHLGEKEHWRKMALWERSNRTPFIIKMPGAEAKRVETPVSLQDIFPTLVDLCDLQLKQNIDDNSLKALITEKSPDWDKPAIMSHGPGNFAIRKDQCRLIHYADGSEELYDIKADDQEFTNLASSEDHQTTLTQLRSHLPKTWAYGMGPRFKNFESSFAAPPKK